MTETNLIDLARKQLWFASYHIDDTGELAFGIEGVNVLLDGNCRLAVRGKRSGFTPFSLCSSPDEAFEACDVLLKHMTQIARASGRRAPRSLEKKLTRLFRMIASRPAREPVEDKQPAVDAAG